MPRSRNAGDEEEYAVIGVLQTHADLATDDFHRVRDWPAYAGRSGRKYAPDGLTYLVEPHPTVEIATPRIAEGLVRVTVRSVATAQAPAAETPAELFVEVISSESDVAITVLDSPSPDDTDVRIEPGAWRGTVTLTIRGKSRRLVTQRSQIVVIGGEAGAPTFAAGELGAETVVDPSPPDAAGNLPGRGLSARRHSFQLDERNLFPQPVLPGW
jgi:hypothetical protein